MEKGHFKISIADTIDQTVEWITINFSSIFDRFSLLIDNCINLIIYVLTLINPIVLIIILSIIAYILVSVYMSIFTLIGFSIILNLGYWLPMIETFSLVFVSVIISILLGIPIGIISSQHKQLSKFTLPILDFMQTMPAFVYLIPAIFFFSIGVVPGIVASIIFSLPSVIKLTILGIKQVPKEIIEVGHSFGTKTHQLLFKIQIPLAMPTIMAGINQCIMLSLSMVVIASMVGAPGLGAEVYRAVTQIEIGKGFEAGIVIVILAIFLDRITQKLSIIKWKDGGRL
ncbi:glycine betaine/proline transport system permease protein [Cytobacillus horneckiae]|uniref:Glycine/betaine ABC transporter n=1 Tax=Cytobacillus horneckiae TaxID=549687 RepID=A0A2N0ZC21_9BACI|nr:ABC transporter permease subunit [Cytobacillus horneckiae]MBN6886044.1 ABC transporter permease subunit [Cytobacillus horneckiae]MEC1159173.1 ABC transporter permease subunit [Cytobacillus horneckiae]MED2940754.1 ABC transporter permease subunit [Cytobacillus horneckiae]PKG27025.1 glycine/betaine ABC transporter [Cytobacillus horneckiae]